jgi:proteasome accessory factor B
MQVSSEERVFSLLLALASTQIGLTKHEILTTVHGYSLRYADASNRSNVERQFERDKDALRDIGIPIEAFEPLDEPGNNQLTRYRVQRELLQLPDNIEFSQRELALLRLAAFAWRDSTLESESRSALMKMSSLGHAIDTSLMGIAPRITANDPSFAPLQGAAQARKVVTFEYLAATADVPSSRRVAPLALKKLDGRWHLITWDFHRDAARVFLLSRIVSPVKILSESYDDALVAQVDIVMQELNDLRNSQIAQLQLVPGTEAASRLTPSLNYLDENILAEELVAFGGDVFVLSPVSLRDRVIALLRNIRDVHANPTDRSGA